MVVSFQTAIIYENIKILVKSDFYEPELGHNKLKGLIKGNDHHFYSLATSIFRGFFKIKSLKIFLRNGQ